MLIVAKSLKWATTESSRQLSWLETVRLSKLSHDVRLQYRIRPFSSPWTDDVHVAWRPSYNAITSQMTCLHYWICREWHRTTVPRSIDRKKARSVRPKWPLRAMAGPKCKHITPFSCAYVTTKGFDLPTYLAMIWSWRRLPDNAVKRYWCNWG